MKAPEKHFENFSKETANHTMTVLRDDGLYRHLVFSENGSPFYRFELITWPGHLCITGDMNTYTFSRVPDMFNFFRGNNAEEINPGYWAEKLLAEDRNSSWGKKWSQEKFEEAVTEYLNSSLDEEEEPERSKKISSEVKEQIDQINDEHESIEFIRNFNFEDFTFDDFWEYSTEEYTPHYLWCCHAIVWGIQQYDALPKQEPKPKALQQLLQITELAYQISTNKNAHVFINYYGHCGQLDVHANPTTTRYKNGDSVNNRLLDSATYIHGVNFQPEKLEAELDAVINGLETLHNNKEVSPC